MTFGNIRSVGLSFLLISSVFLTACSSAEIINALKIAAQAASIAAPIIAGATNLPPNVTAYVNASVVGLQCVSGVLMTGDTKAQTANNIAKCGLVSAAPVVPSGTPANVVKALTDLSTATDSILKQYPQNFAAAKGSKPVKLKLSHSDMGELAKIQASLAASKARLH